MSQQQQQQQASTNNQTTTSWLLSPLWPRSTSSSKSPTPEQQQQQESKSPPISTPKRNIQGGKTVRHKTSTTSLASMTSGNWLGWRGTTATGTAAAVVSTSGTVNEDDSQTDKEQANEADSPAIHKNEAGVGIVNSNVDDDEDIIPDDNGDEVSEHANINKKTTIWNFWNTNYQQGSNESIERGGSPTSNNSASNATTKKSKIKEIDPSNTILNSTHEIPPELSDLPNKKKQKKKDEIKVDDAVLYKPHDNAAQFQQINTHKNENLRENIIVPDWNTCLPPSQESSSIASHFFSSTTSNDESGTGGVMKTDLRNWRQLLSTISSKFGFNLSSIPTETTTNSDGDKLEKEFGSLYERSYKLYGKSLTVLPEYKRACLPNYNKYFAGTTTNGAGSNAPAVTAAAAAAADDDDDEPHPPQEPTQLEEDHREGGIAIDNDLMGNLLINPNVPSHHESHIPSEIINQKSGPLKKIKKILIIGVHGFFPTKMIRPIIGAPQGTSLKFANEAEKAIIRYCIENQLISENESNVSIQKIALEKEGKIFDRVEFFSQILGDWQKELNQADFIFIASHSQGCVVSIILLARLIKMGILRDSIHKRIGILGMAGINNGPFYGADKSLFMKAYSAIEHDSLIELFEFNKFNSELSMIYKQSMRIIINHNVKLCFIGSINDQLVPLYSALASHVFHPNIYRACYIDYSSNTPPFVQKLVSLCCQLLNMGYFDNNVLKELSISLAGPLTGGGHSKIYNDGKVYDLGVKFVLDTDDIIIPSKGIEEELILPQTNQLYIKEFNVGKLGTNPYILPWCLRGLLFNIEKNWPKRNIKCEYDQKCHKNGYEEINELYEIFNQWKPETKLLKELKFRLNGLRISKL
ncbi:uncharacterized protein J8A68_000782 [[Candida] subhashii]|uniref:YMC020W-like alpha/beta hydrolase domain-containing protein n=1 Tax=[Candida] subhashii TaxID=561895 RepID=A0A8J5UU49_9ASCO|nr:uncharacterized protein J8A68_000782 [[Candida] subhashii]KAG7665762.1 hypothetical protein J8A68_000782 [[Candida] subhashii]